MGNLLRRINRLIKKLKPIGPRLLTLFYRDGSERVMPDSVNVFTEILSGQVMGYRYHNEDDGADNFYAALMAGCPAGISKLFADGDDSWMLEGLGNE